MLNRAARFFPALVIAAGIAGARIPSDGGAVVSLAVPVNTVSVGDSLTAVLTVVVPDGVQAGDPEPRGADPLLGWEKRTVREEKTAGGVVRRYGYLAWVCAVDSVRLGPFAVRWADASGKSGEALSDSLVLAVNGLVTDVGSPAKPSRSPFEIASKGLPWWAYAVPVALVAAAAAWWLSRRRRKPAVTPAAPLRPIDEIGEFERIRSLRLQETGRVKDLYALVSEAMRGFMHRNMGFEALFRTTEEIKRSLDRYPCDDGLKRTIGGLFDESDRVKFAKFVPPEEAASTLIDRAVEPVKGILDHLERERERARLAEEERKRSARAGKTAGVPAGVSAGGGER